MNPFGGQIILIIIIIASMVFTSGGFSLETIIFGLPALLVAFSFHEFSHALIAVKLGDPTPKLQGRLTLDIRKHIDPVGMLLLLFAGFGWAKPVETDTRNLKNPKRDMALIALAGPMMNVIIAIISVIIILKVPTMDYKMSKVLYYFFTFNAGLAAFNLIPVPPLDGSRIIGIFMTNKFYYKFQEFEYKYQSFLIIGLILFAVDIFRVPLKIIVSSIFTAGVYIAALLPF